MPSISERSEPAAYRGALVGAALRRRLGDECSDRQLDDAARRAGLHPPSESSRTAVRGALGCPVDFEDDCDQDVAQAVFDAAEEAQPLVVVTASKRRVVMVPHPVD